MIIALKRIVLRFVVLVAGIAREALSQAQAFRFDVRFFNCYGGMQ